MLSPNGNPLWLPAAGVVNVAQSSLVAPTPDAELSCNAPSVTCHVSAATPSSTGPALTCHVSGANASEKLSSAAPTPSHERTAAGLVALVIWIRRNVPDTPTGPPCADALSVNANAVAPAPTLSVNACSVTSS